MLVAKRYRLGPSIGRGGMGEVFRATDEQLGRAVAVKVLLPSDPDARAAERFHREARAAARLNDPHVVSVYDFGNHGDGFFLVMELVEGGTVADELAGHGTLPKDRAIQIVEQAAAGLAAAHREDVVHRDVKPGNLLLAADGTVKVADFGIAQLPGDGATTLTAAGQIIGSTLYLSPERARGGQAGKAADVYSLGCVLYQLVTGRPPFTAEHPTAILYQHVDTAPTPPSAIDPELGGAFEAVLLRMLAKDPADRPSAAEIADGALRAHGGQTVAAAVPAAVGAAEPPAPATGVLESVDSSGRRRTRILLAAAIAVLATAGAVFAGVLLNREDPRVPPTTDVGPQPGVTSRTPASTPRTSSTDPTRSSTTNETTSGPTTQAPSQSPASTPSSPTTSRPTTTPPSTTAPSTPPQTSTTPTEPTGTPTETSSSTPPPDTPSSTPASGSPTPAGELTGIQPGDD
ncbi:serine/threonine protein kinase [Kribbella turkmenica]|uniref:non-specific serine/threonine protein kinase n=1 Tax=Kribbella turkmenica TaxID=2530375 RepID=A0A4R4X0P5_9ACTN|nr:serine/threonine-protein kinase [Kribbella turkmenica]TDD23739.1 serine/threonine protein kinase [Kribbella turkmenica]